MSSNKIICFGEILWDIFPGGKMLGGAPFNVAASIHGLGGNVQFISRVGNDSLGYEITEKMKEFKPDIVGVSALFSSQVSQAWET